MKKSLIMLNIIVMFLAVLIIITLENFIDGFFIAPIIECIVIFLAVLFIKWISDDSIRTIIFLAIILFFCFETTIYLICVNLGLIQSSIYEVLSFRIIYGGLFTFIWIPITLNGLKYKNKILWILFLVVGCLIHLIINLIMSNF